MAEHVVADAGAFLKNAALHVRFRVFFEITLKRFAISVLILSHCSVYIEPIAHFD